MIEFYKERKEIVAANKDSIKGFHQYSGPCQYFSWCDQETWKKQVEKANRDNWVLEKKKAWKQAIAEFKKSDTYKFVPICTRPKTPEEKDLDLSTKSTNNKVVFKVMGITKI